MFFEAIRLELNHSSSVSRRLVQQPDSPVEHKFLFGYVRLPASIRVRQLTCSMSGRHLLIGRGIFVHLFVACVARCCRDTIKRCSACPAGYYCPASSPSYSISGCSLVMSCVAADCVMPVCPAGSYNSLTGKSNSSSCLGLGQRRQRFFQSVVACPTGTYSAAASPACTCVIECVCGAVNDDGNTRGG